MWIEWRRCGFEDANAVEIFQAIDDRLQHLGAVVLHDAFELAPGNDRVGILSERFYRFGFGFLQIGLKLLIFESFLTPAQRLQQLALVRRGCLVGQLKVGNRLHPGAKEQLLQDVTSHAQHIADRRM